MIKFRSLLPKLLLALFLAAAMASDGDSDARTEFQYCTGDRGTTTRVCSGEQETREDCVKFLLKLNPDTSIENATRACRMYRFRKEDGDYDENCWWHCRNMYELWYPDTAYISFKFEDWMNNCQQSCHLWLVKGPEFQEEMLRIVKEEVERILSNASRI